MALLTVQQTAERYGVTEQTVRRWCREGVIDAEHIGRKWLIPDRERPAQALEGGTGQSDEVLVTSTLGGQYTWSIY